MQCGFSITIAICMSHCYTDMGFHTMCWQHQSHVLIKFLFRVYGSLLWCCGTSLGLELWNRLHNSTDQQLVVTFLGCSWESYIRAWVPKKRYSERLRDGQQWYSLLSDYDMGWIMGEFLWHLPKTTLQVCFFSRASRVDNVWLCD